MASQSEAPRVKVFVYGSNMCGGWLKHGGISSARFVAVAVLREHDLRFHKRSLDGSGKADAYRTGSSSDVVWGVVLEMNEEDKAKLDRVEGLGHGYAERTVGVEDSSGGRHGARVYLAQGSSVDPSLRPYSWYKRLVGDGARANALPPYYVERLAAVESWEDPDSGRAAKAQGIAC